MHLASWRSSTWKAVSSAPERQSRILSRTFANASGLRAKAPLRSAASVASTHEDEAPKPPSAATIEWRRRRIIQDDFEGRSLYRSLLRETAFFPDEWARSYMLRQIIRRFRAYHNSPLQKSMAHHEWIKRMLSVRKKARKYLRGLQRANAGKHKEFIRVLLHAYGRRGERRRRLIQDVQPLTVANDDLSSKAPANRFVPRMSAKLQAVAASQNQALVMNSTVLRIKRPGSTQPSIPQFNSWHRPMPQIRVKNMTADWWADLLDKLVPPLPLHEWLRLYDLASGKVTNAAKAPRQGGMIKGGKDPLEMLITSRNSRVHLQPDLVRHTTPTKCQRAWEEIFRVCPVLQHENDKWHVIWGYQALHDPEIAEDLKVKARAGTAYSFRVAGERGMDLSLFDAYLCKLPTGD